MNWTAAVAYTLLLNDDRPGWLNGVKLGSATIWERWNSLLQTALSAAQA